MNQTIRERVAEALEELRPRLQADGGDVELLGVDNGIVHVRLEEACAGCPMATITIKM
jgi:Fe-S cluster biogenesis protein NfuA